MEGLKIGITIGLKSNTESIWTNGIKQNILMLHRLLKNSHKKYEVFLLNTIDVDWSTKPSYLDDVNISYFDDNYENMDFIIVMGAQIDNDKMLKFKSIKKENKIISYKCGSNYILTTENILFKNDDKWTTVNLLNLDIIPKKNINETLEFLNGTISINIL